MNYKKSKERNELFKSLVQKARRKLLGEAPIIPATIKIISNEDGEFRDKVEYLLSQSEIISNPVHYLVDEKTINSMSDIQKERYIFSTLDKYISLRDDLEKSHKSIS